MRIQLILLLIAAAASARNLVRVSTARDATVGYNGLMNGDGTFDAFTPKGMEKQLVALSTETNKQRILLGFEMPQRITKLTRVRRCKLHVPRPIERPQHDYMLTAYEASSNWEERTVTAAAGVRAGRRQGSVVVRKGHNPHKIDVTEACRAIERGGRFSVFLDSSGPLVSFFSRNSARRPEDKFSVEILFY
ncbi:hypothetical protein LPJ68_004662 [Coemansia sp. RSA 1086]|nr:hypothetical protein LPJ68_004662 [Coemansia sp. RSA 1086]